MSKGERADRLAGWGRQFVPGREICSEDLEDITREAVLTRGLGRSYGDSSLPPPDRLEVAGSRLADRLLSFDPETGSVRAEAGLSLRELIRVFLPRGWFPPVTPGTAFVTLGGMVAADVHGKNHHRDGCFGEHVRSLRMRVADGRIIECSREVEPALFRATLGGMGLTGHILEVEFALQRVPSPWIYCETVKVPDVESYLAALEDARSTWPFTVGWIDCLTRGRSLGRGILYRGRWAEPSEAPRRFPRPKPRLRVPFDLPEWILGRWSVRIFNALKYATHPRRVRRGIVHPDGFFYPLDVIRDWNRMYGRRGMTQHQSVLPNDAGPGAVRRFLELLTSLGGASFLCVIKDCGAEGTGLLSFPRPGTSIALDIAVRDDTQALIDALNEFVLREGGRIYLAKDAFTRPEHFRAMEPRLEQFQRIRRAWDPEGRIRSAQSVRLFGDPA
ncbi:MAG TPA: FAD-binding oxidoreductase [Myxococcaceae bacterium]|nr:FAD-binding oxidoreductase [Myxococcaceae bacterium]